MPAADPTFPFLEHDGPIPFAHRGGAAGGLENSMAAFQRAVDLGYRYLETDVHATADGVLLAFHDRDARPGHRPRGPGRRAPLAEVSRARIGGAEPIPLLEDLLGHLAGRPDQHRRQGAPAPIGPLVEADPRTGAVDRVCVASFSDRRLAAVRPAVGPAPVHRRSARAASPGCGPRRAPGWPTGSLRAASRAPRSRTGSAGYGWSRPAWSALAHALGQQVHVWTIDDPAEMHRLLDLGVDGLMTDQLVTLRDVLRARGHWASLTAVRHPEGLGSYPWCSPAGGRARDHAGGPRRA